MLVSILGESPCCIIVLLSVDVIFFISIYVHPTVLKYLGKWVHGKIDLYTLLSQS
jgi:hypothetical protein